MNNIDEKSLETALAVGESVCDELGICCQERGRVIFGIYRKLRSLKSPKAAAEETEVNVEKAQEKESEAKKIPSDRDTTS